VTRGFVNGNPGLLHIRERATADPEDIVHAVAVAIGNAYAPAPVRIPLQEIVFLVGKPRNRIRVLQYLRQHLGD
jgi:hypothetical protein